MFKGGKGGGGKGAFSFSLAGIITDHSYCFTLEVTTGQC